jgi:hypothetical protein
MINEKLKKLYIQYYADKVERIVLCGVVDERVYLSSRIKIVFVLKEPHSRDGGWSMPINLRRQVQRRLGGQPFEKGWSFTWIQAGVWAYAILNGFSSYNELKKPALMARGIQAIGMTNLKKTGGGATSKPKVISAHARKDFALWRRELEIMKPDLIICGNTYRDVADNLKLDKVKLLTRHKTPYYYSLWDFNTQKTIILDFWHPNHRGNRAENLKLLQQVMNRLREEAVAKFLFD